MKKGLFSKYQCDNKLKIYINAPLSNSQYKKMIENAKSRYMNDYYNAPKFNRRNNEKSFNNLIESYFGDFRKMKKKYNLIEQEQSQEENSEEKNYINYEEFHNKKNIINKLFSSYDIPDFDEINFDLTDNIVRSLYDKKNDSLLRNTQTKDDYDLRLNDNNNDINNPNCNHPSSKGSQENVEDNTDNKDSGKVTSDDEKEIDELFYLDNENQYDNNDDNYLKLNYNKNNLDELPLFEDIINSDYDKRYDYDPPLYQDPTKSLMKTKNEKQEKNEPLKAFQDMVINNNYPLFEQLINPYFSTNYKPQLCFPKKSREENEEKDLEENEYEGELENDENIEKEYNDFDNNNNENGADIDEKNGENKEEDENLLKLKNNQKINGDNDLLIFENIISNDFKDDYIIPSYKMPYYIEKEIKNEEIKRKKEKEEYEKKKNQNILNKSENGEIKMLNDIIKEEEKPKVEDIINSDNKVLYNPTNNIQKSENDEKNSQNKNIRYNGYEEGDFIQASENTEVIKNNMVENIINSNKSENYSLPNYSGLNPKQNEAEKNEDMKKEMMGEVINYDKYKGSEYPTVGEIIKKRYNEEEIQYPDLEKVEEKEEQKEEENNNKKESINNKGNKSDDNFDKIDVDDLNDDEIEDNE